jgi:hypothetical protein
MSRLPGEGATSAERVPGKRRRLARVAATSLE